MPNNLSGWLRQRTDTELLTLLRLRPDLSAPTPADLVTLATRVSVRSSVQRSMDGLDALALRVLEAISLFNPGSPEQILAGLGGGSDGGGSDGGLEDGGGSPGAAPVPTAADVAAAYDRLFARALIWGPRERPHLLGPVPDLLGPFAAGLGSPAAELFGSVSGLALAPVLRTLGLPPAPQPEAGEAITAVLADPDRVRALIAGRTDAERDVLRRLADGPPVAALPAATLTATALPTPKAAAGDDDPIGGLLAHGLLAPSGPGVVQLPREVGVIMRGLRPLGIVAASAPDPLPLRRDPGDVDSTGSVAVMQLLRLVDTLARAWTDDPPHQLRSSGLGVRDLKRTARALGISEADAATVIEITVAADLIAAPAARDVPWLPTTDYDTWAARDPATRWTRLAQTWRTMTRQPHLVGERDERGKSRAALSYEVERAGAAALRAEVLNVLVRCEPGAAGPPAAVLAHLAWLLPRRQQTQRAAAAAVLAEAELVGITAGGGLTSYGRAILTGAPALATETLAAALPEPVADFLLQPDLTVVVPGPPTADLARELMLVADLESAGGASVYRLTEASLRRAFDAGRTAADLSALFASRSRTPVPQALTYLVDDLARRHGVLRAGDAVSYLRCDDSALLDRAVTDRAVGALHWHRLAPTVAVSPASTHRVLEVLREAGYAPAAEDTGGGTVAIGADPSRSRPRRPESARNVPAFGVREEQFAEAVRRMRTGDELSRTAHKVTVSQDIPGVTSATTLGVLRQAIRSDQQVWVSYVDAAGSAVTKILEPLSLGGGFLRGHDVDTKEFRSIPLHRVTSVNVLA